MLRFPAAALCLFSLLTLSGCATKNPLACPAGGPGRTARVFFATDRKRSDVNPQTYSGAQTSPPGLQMGWQEIALGATHRLGVLDTAIAVSPPQVARDSRRSASASATELWRTDAEINAYVGTTVRAALRASPPPRAGQRRHVVFFIHGYNTTFDYAVRKTAQLAADLELVGCDGSVRGLAVAYSWPAQGTILSYLADEENAEWTQQRLAPFVAALAEVCHQENAELTLVAHSMGCRALVRALTYLAYAHSSAPTGVLAQQLVLLAPDIGRGLFDQYVERIMPLVGHLTIYVSAKDHALALSSILHGGHHRLGLLESTVLTALQLTGLSGEDHRELGFVASAGKAGSIDMIDVTGGLADRLGHSYEDEKFIYDLRALIYHRTPAGTGDRSNLQSREVRPGLFGLFGKHLRYFKLSTN